ncbi:MAG: hypothetical protein K0R76_1243 [Alphaproteobacteria bacterium]|jgi:hypothetical protein|nr:hypothetical protein [Alphaproteobacteria bacterium]
MAFPVIAAALGLAGFAPLIARWLGGDQAQDVATKVVDIAQKITGTLDPVEAIQQLEKNPNLVSAFQKAIIQVEAEMELAVMKDRQDARLRDVALMNAGRSNIRADIMVIAAAVGLILCLASLAYFSEALPGEAVGIISTISGIFGACLKDAYSFEFGSSRGSKEKDNAVAALMDRYPL